MRVDGDGVLPTRAVEPDIGGFAADAGQGLQLLTRVRNFAPEIIDQFLAEFDDVGGFGVKQADGLDVFFKSRLAEFEHFLRRIGGFEQGGGGLVDADIGRLRGQDDGHQQRIFIGELQLRDWMRVGGRETGEYLVDFLFVHGR